MSASTIERARPHMTSLTTELIRAGAIRSREWTHVFGDVPRHLFVPRWFQQDQNERGITVWREHRGAATDDDLEAVYRDQTLVTALDPDTAERVDDTAWTGIPTSSSTLPSLMAGMLEDLTVKDGHRVLEVGTGTGYNAALLSARLGEHLVHSVDIDPDTIRDAREHLASAGFVPQVVAGDGTRGYPEGGTFDRIIATCSVPVVPAAWIEQSEPGTIIVADIALGIEGGLVRLKVDDRGRAAGRFTTTAGRFMAARSEAKKYPPRQGPERAPETGTLPSAVSAADIRAHYAFRLLLSVSLPEAELVYHLDDAGNTSLQIHGPDGSWARAALAGDHAWTITYGGDPGLWRQVEAAWLWWCKAGRPSHDTFTYTREADGRAYASYAPDGSRWNLPTVRA
ncbi:methyltransferase domain-containing protein [Streptomyces sp. NPDC093111]|uniref:methyltransferase domain-containing protein n=1 Tax=Streptomyces sp. NPDC093111 TaxID=3154978 RepID=UPI003432ADF6